MFEDTIVVIRSIKAKTDRHYNAQTERLSHFVFCILHDLNVIYLLVCTTTCIVVFYEILQQGMFILFSGLYQILDFGIVRDFTARYVHPILWFVSNLGC